MDKTTTSPTPQNISRKKMTFFKYVLFFGVSSAIVAATFFVVRTNDENAPELPRCVDELHGIPFYFVGRTYFIHEDGTRSLYNGETFGQNTFDPNSSGSYQFGQRCLSYNDSGIKGFQPISFLLDSLIFFVVIAVAYLFLRRRRPKQLEKLREE